MQIFPSSDQLKARATDKNEKKGRKRLYPWVELEIGQSFPILASKMKFGTAVSLAYKSGKRYKRKFIVYNHGETYEVGRIE